MIRALAVAFVCVCGAPAAADAPPGAQELLDRGLRSYAVGQYAEAIASFRAGFRIDPRPDFLYALAQAQRMGGDCRSAVAAYRAFLRTGPPEKAAISARQNLERCEAQLAAALPPEKQRAASSPETQRAASSPETQRAASSPETQRAASPPMPERPRAAAADPARATTSPSPTVERAARRVWYRDPAGDVLGALGAAFLGAGGALWGVGESGVRAANAAERYDQFANGPAAERERTIGIVGVALGGALLVGAVARWVYVARHHW